MHKKACSILLAAVLLLSCVFVTRPQQAEAAESPATGASAAMLGVKVQFSAAKADGRIDMRVVSAVDSLDYKNVGFQVWYGDATANPTDENVTRTFTTGSVFSRIKASAVTGDYRYSPKVIDTSAAYFITGIIKNIKAENFDKNFYIRAFCTNQDGTVQYGAGRFFTVNELSNASIINIPIAMDAAPATSGGNILVPVTLGGIATTATLKSYVNGYAHVNVTVPAATYSSTAANLPSASKVVVGSDSIIYRNLLSSSITTDKSWYEIDPDADVFIIATASDLYGLASLSQENTFAGKTIYLVADVEANIGTASESGWSGSTSYQWIGIGKAASQFAGHFDGQGHTISGIYTPRGKSYVGLFNMTQSSAVVENFRLENSAFVYTETIHWNRVGSVVGAGCGTLRNIYSSAFVTSSGAPEGSPATKPAAGGIIGMVQGATTISNCQFDGQVKATYNFNFLHVGGIAGWVYNGPVTMEHCLNSGTVNASAADSSRQARIGGLVGCVGDDAVNGGRVVIKDSLNTGLVTRASGTSAISTLIGIVRNSTAVTLSKCYATVDSLNVASLKADANNNFVQAWTGTTVSKDLVEMLYESESSYNYKSAVGSDGYTNTQLDFDHYWTAVEGGTPVLTSFVTDETTVDLSNTDRTVKASQSWLNYAAGTEDDPYVIEDASDLYGLAAKVNGANGAWFSGQYIVLANDITVNKTGRDTWGTAAPPNSWFAGNAKRTFAGHLDGQGHTISGLYYSAAFTKGNTTYLGLFSHAADGCVIENLSLKNCAFTNSTLNQDYCRMGSFVGQTAGTTRFENLYSDAVLTNGGYVVGGIVGTNYGAATISNCWFAGSITSSKNNANNIAGGILGWAVANATVEHCLNSGTVYAATATATGNVHTGGLVGRIDSRDATSISTVATPAVTIDDCLNTGKVSSAGATYRIATLVGSSNSSAVTITNTYATTESCGVALSGNNRLYQAPATVNKTNVAMVNAANLYGAAAVGNTALDFDTYWYALSASTPRLQYFHKGSYVDVSGVERSAAVIASTAWLSAAEGTEADPYVLTSAEDLYGLADAVNGGNHFADKYIVLADDIVVNRSDRSTWGENTPPNTWLVGSAANYFAGHLNGQGHTISGLYCNKTASSPQYLGLFSHTAEGCVIENLSLKNSAFSCAVSSKETDDYGRMGSFAAWANAGTFRNLYSDAILINSQYIIGGIVGLSNGTVTISNCAFDGEIHAQRTGGMTRAGGILGWVAGGTTTIEHCLNSGSIHSVAGSDAQARVGGILGHAWEGTVTINDCLNTGAITTEGATSAVATLVGLSGYAYGEAEYPISMTVTNSYATIESCGVEALKAMSYYNLLQCWTGKTASMDSSVAMLSAAGTDGYPSILGHGGYLNTTLDFTNYWVAVQGKAPALRTFFTGSELDTSAMQMDTSWYTGSADTYTIHTAEELYGLAALSEKVNFSGVTIQLGNDIVYNSGDAADWSTDAPAHAWLPIGSKNCEFAGTFDGQGHTISGLYDNKTDKTTRYPGLFAYTAAGAVIENLRLTNSVFTYAGTGDYGRIGSFVAWADGGTFRNLYSDAILTNSEYVTGGIVGVTNGAVDISKCWFDGEIHVQRNDIAGAGGILGWAAGATTIEHCLNSGDISRESSVTGKGNQIGGILGRMSAAVEISDCLNTGTVDGNGVINQITAVVGSVVSGGALTINGVYATQESLTDYGSFSAANISGNQHLYQTNKGVITSSANVAMVTQASLAGESAKTNTALDFTNYWAITEGSPTLRSFAASDRQVSILNPDAFEVVWADEFTVPTEMTDYAEKVSQLSNPSGRMLSFAHRGDMVYYPENSAEAVISAVQMGADMIEVDVWRTSDNELVLMHDLRYLYEHTDWALKAGTNGLPTSCDGQGWTLAQLRQLRLVKDGVVTDYQIPTLGDAMQICKGRAKLVVDTHPGVDDIESVTWDEIYPVIVSHEAWDTVIISTEYNNGRQQQYVDALRAASNYTANVFVFRSILNDPATWETQFAAMESSHLNCIAFWQIGKNEDTGTLQVTLSEETLSDAQSYLDLYKDSYRIIGQNYAQYGGDETPEMWSLLYSKGVRGVTTDRLIDLQKYIAETWYND